MLGGGPGVGGNQAYHALGGGHGRVVAQPSDVALAVHRDGGDAVGAGFVDGHAHGPLGYHETEAPVAVDDSGAGGLPLHHEGCAGDDVPHIDALSIGRNLDDAMGVVAAQVGLDQVRGHHLRLRLRGPLGAVDVEGRLVQVFRRKNRHYRTSPLRRNAGGPVCGPP